MRALRFFLFSFFLLICCPTAIFANTIVQEVRIAVLKNADTFTVTARGRYRVIDPKTQSTLQRGRELRQALVKATKDGLYVGQNYFGYGHVRIIATKDLRLHFDGKIKIYRGALDIFRQENGQMLVINRVDLERYVRGVLYHEVSDKWPMEAMKAQAVATRTYALYQMQQNKDQLFDVTSDIYSQVYGGKKAERFRTTIASNRTRGQVLLFDNEILPAYFHSNSGGYTEDVRELWKHDLPPLYGRADPFAEGAPSYVWKKNFRSKDVQEALEKAGYEVGLIKDIRVIERNKSGRIRFLEIESRSGIVTTMTGKKFREIVGPNKIRSNFYDIVMQGYYFDLHGKGWGHGVGMCQWGAHNMAKQRKAYDQILTFYYPQTQLVDYRQGNTLVKNQ